MSNTVEAVKERLTAAEIIGRRVQLRQAGRNLKGLCCFHSEKTPSFFVFPETNTYKCFGCNEGGDIFTFVMKNENLEFRDALRQLAEEAGVPLSDSPQMSAQAAARKAHISANSVAAAFFQQQLNETPVAQSVRDYAARRGLDAATLERFQLGFAPKSGDVLRGHMNSLGYNEEDLTAAGLTGNNERGVYEVFRNRLMFPIADRRGDIVGFGGREMGDHPAKYMNTPQTAAFDKGGVLYGLNLARESIRESGTAVVVEGYMDAIAAHQHGFDNVVAAMGTAITPSQVRLLRGIAKRVVIALDADAAGTAATRRSLEMVSGLSDEPTADALDLESLTQHEDDLRARIFVAALPAETDPDDVIRSDPAAWEQVLEDAAPLADYLFAAITDGIDPGDFAARAEAMRQAVPIIQGLAEPAVRTHYVSRLATALHIPEEDIQHEVRLGRQRTRNTPPPVAAPGPELRRDDYLLALGMGNLTYFRTIAANVVRPEDYSNSENRLLAEYFTTIEVNGEAGVDWLREQLDSSLRERFDQLERFRRLMPESEGEDLFADMQRVALRLRRDGLRAENRQLQLIQGEGQSIREDEALAERQRQILNEIREIEKGLR